MTREEAINKVRQMSLPKETMEILQALAPELAESEDERIRRAIIHYILYETKGTISEATEHTWVKWLEKQKERKPSEWSEEDEKYLNRVINLWVNDFGEDSDTVKWLKSLRPSWRPSEEQMKAFKKYIEEFQARAEAAVGGWNNFDVMIRLYEQLKKL